MQAAVEVGENAPRKAEVEAQVEAKLMRDFEREPLRQALLVVLKSLSVMVLDITLVN